jgi:hypothetical protein
MDDKKIVHGQWSEYTAPRRVFRKKMHVHIGGSFREQLRFHPENLWVYPAEYEGLPDKGGFKVILHEKDENMCLYKRLITDKVCIEYPVTHSCERPDNRLVRCFEHINGRYRPIVKEPSKPDVQAASFVVPDQETAKIIIRDFSRQYCEIHGLIYDKMLIDY